MNATKRLIKWLKSLFVKDYVVINGICWDTENGLLWDKQNLCVNGQVFFTWKEAQQAAARVEKRCPTAGQLEALIAAGYTWDDKRIGAWFAGNHSTNHKGSIFIPATGLRNPDDDSFLGAGICGFVWSSTLYSEDHAWLLRIDSERACMCYFNCSLGFPVRCVEEINNPFMGSPGLGEKCYVKPIIITILRELDIEHCPSDLSINASLEPVEYNSYHIWFFQCYNFWYIIEYQGKFYSFDIRKVAKQIGIENLEAVELIYVDKRRWLLNFLTQLEKDHYYIDIEKSINLYSNAIDE